VEKFCRAWLAMDDDMAHAHCMLIPKATNTHSEYVILTAFPLQQWLIPLYDWASHTRVSFISVR
jgi:hypothetical protein